MNKNTNEEFFEVENAYDNAYIKASRAKKTHETRKKIEDHLERKRFKNFYNEIKGIDWDLDYE